MKHTFKQSNRSKKVVSFFSDKVQSIHATKEIKQGNTHTTQYKDTAKVLVCEIQPTNTNDIQPVTWDSTKHHRDTTRFIDLVSDTTRIPATKEYLEKYLK